MTSRAQRTLLSLALAATPVPALAVPYGPGIGGTIPDNDVVGFLSPVVVNENFAITSISLTIHGLQHGYSGDLLITLNHSGVSTPTTLLVNLRNGSSADFNGDYSFADTGANLWLAAQGLSGLQVIPPAAYQASGTSGSVISLNTKYLGENAHGSWTLRIADQSFLVQGGFTGWTLNLGGGPTPPAPCPTDLNGDHTTGTADLVALLTNFGQPCP